MVRIATQMNVSSTRTYIYPTYTATRMYTNKHIIFIYVYIYIFIYEYVYVGSIEAIKLLIENGADIDSKANSPLGVLYDIHINIYIYAYITYYIHIYICIYIYYIHIYIYSHE
jgi:hypothetical protein